MAARTKSTRNWLTANAFKGERFKVMLIPRPEGRPAAVVLGLGRRSPREEFSCWLAAGLPDRLPDGHYHLAQTAAAGRGHAVRFRLAIRTIPF